MNAAARHPNNAAIDERLAQLDREWDVERALQANFAAVSLLGLLLGAKVDKRWLALAGAAPAFMVQHALQGWCPPLALLKHARIRACLGASEKPDLAGIHVLACRVQAQRAQLEADAEIEVDPMNLAVGEHQPALE